LALKEKFRIDDIIFLLLNSGVFFVVGIIALDIAELSADYAGLFTLCNAIIHGFTSWIIYRSEQKGKKMFYWTIGLVIAFFTISIPIQFANYYTAIIWSVEAAIIFLYAKSKKNTVYEYISYALIFLTTISTLINWSSASYSLYRDVIEELFTPILNWEFLSSFVVIALFCFIYYINWKSNKAADSLPKNMLFEITFPLLILFIIYFSFFTQITLYWRNIQVYASFEISPEGIWKKQFDYLNRDITSFMSIWLINYSLIFASLLSFGNFKWFKNKNFDAFILVVNYLMILIFLTVGLGYLTQLRESYISTNLPANYDVSLSHLIIRYVSLAFFTFILYSNYSFVVRRLNLEILTKIFEITLCISIVWAGSSELINWLQLSGSTEIYKHGLSILWGVFALIFIVYGIWKNKKHIRISAIVLIGITLIKLFLYDLTNLKTIPKTIVFVSIGILFLIISFLYNKYRNAIFGNE
jgi:hypothetical protein